MININQERSLLAAIIPPLYFHVRSITSVSIEEIDELLYATGWLCSIPIDFYIKALNKATLYVSDLAKLPVPISSSIEKRLKDEICKRASLLNCSSPLFAELFNYSREIFGLPVFTQLTKSLEKELNAEEIAPLSDLFRRNLLVETDVLCAKALGISIDQLIAIYSVQFPVAKQYERQTFYDQKGKIVFTTSKGLPGVGFPRIGSGRGSSKTTGWEDISEMTSGTVERTIVDDTLPGGPVERSITYEAPFDRCDRVGDYRVVWEFFEKEGVGA